MERLSVGADAPYDAREAAMHVGRYALALPFAQGRRVLDAACGEGYGSFLLAEAGAAEVVGIDIAEEAVAAARATFRHDRLRFATGAGEALAALLPAAHFDLVVSIETIEHVADPEAYLHAIRRVATPDAVIVVTCPNDHWYYGEAEGNPHHRSRFRLAEFQALTTRILGGRVQWLLGSATFGFGMQALRDGDAVALRDGGNLSPRIVDVAPQALELSVPAGADGPTTADCAYFAGLWNAPATIAGVGARHALSMEHYRRLTEGAAAAPRLAELQAALDWHVARVDTLDGDLRWHVDRVREQDALLATQAEQLRSLAASLDTHVERLRSQGESLDWHAERVRSLGEALDWHVARVDTLDGDLRWHVARVREQDTLLAAQAAHLRAMEEEPASRLLARGVARLLRAARPARWRRAAGG